LNLRRIVISLYGTESLTNQPGTLIPYFIIYGKTLLTVCGTLFM
jgi:hypothetical protein